MKPQVYNSNQSGFVSHSFKIITWKKCWCKHKYRTTKRVRGGSWVQSPRTTVPQNPSSSYSFLRTSYVHTCRPKAIACIPKKDIQQCFVEEGALQYVDHPKRDLVGATDEEKAPGKNSSKETLPRRTESGRQIRPKKTFVLSFFVNTYVGHYI